METPLPLKILCSGTYSKCKNIIGYLFLEKWETTVAVKSSHGVFSPSTQLLVYSGLEEKRKKANKIPKKSLIFWGIFLQNLELENICLVLENTAGMSLLLRLPCCDILIILKCHKYSF